MQTLPIVDNAFWNELERHILDWGAQPHEYLLCRQHTIPRWDDQERKKTKKPPDRIERIQYRDQPMGAGQRVLDHTHGNLKAVQKLLGHSSTSTTGDIYVDWDIDQLAAVLPEMQEEAEK